MTPKASTPTDLIAVKVMHERQWAYALWLERLTPMQIRIAANAPASEGGLGYDLSVQAIKGLVEQARADNGDVVLGREERRERQLIEVDARARAARRDLDKLMRARDRLDHQIATFPAVTVQGKDDEAALAALSTLAELHDARRHFSREIESAEKRLDMAQEREAKLIGLNAPAEANVTVTTRDGVLDDLNAALARMGEEPIPTAPERH